MSIPAGTPQLNALAESLAGANPPSLLEAANRLAHQLSTAAFNAGFEDAGDAWTGQEKTAIKQDQTLASLLNAIRALAAEAEQSASVPVTFTEAGIDEYVDGYVMEHDGAFYTPNDHERFLVKDAIMGLIGTEHEQQFNQSASATSVKEPVRGERWYILRNGAKICSEVTIELVTPAVIGIKKNSYWGDVEVVPRGYLTLVERVASAPTPPARRGA